LKEYGARALQLEQRVDAASFGYLIGNAAIPLIGSAAGSVLVAIALLETGGSQSVIAWLLFIYATTGLRLWLNRRSKLQLHANGYRRGEAMGYALSISLSGLAWGMVVLLLHDASPVGSVIAITVTQAMVMGGVVTLGVFMPAFLSFSLPALLPMIVVYATGGNTTSIVLALYCSVFLLLMIGIAVRFNGALRQTWQLRFENDDLVKALTTAHDHLAIQAKSDGLTGVANRRRFDEVLETEYSRLRRSGAPLSLIFLDVDNFKAFNDTYGHIEGDECLKAIAATLQKLLLRASDFVARYGGEEFAVVLPETDHVGAVTLAENIRTQVAELLIPHSASLVESYVTVSLGVVTLDCAKISSPADALSMADRQLYLAKAAGRNRIASLDTLDVSHMPTALHSC
jgi:diguanylate cyclase (GGDEF)-like protein